MALFGNVSSEGTLLHGSVEEVRREVRSQIQRAGSRGGFLSCSGPPICFGTPERNVEALIQAARDFRWGG
jgi:uroporphyrinogen-III decarboxylase